MLMAERSLVEMLRALAGQRGRDKQNPLLLLHSLESSSGEEIDHLALNPTLAQAWTSMTTEPFRPHQALALAALRQRESFCLLGNGSLGRQTLQLLLNEDLKSHPGGKALFVVPTETLAEIHWAAMHEFNQHLPVPLEPAYVESETSPRIASRAAILLTTPEVLHERLLRYHDRAWLPFWAKLRLILVADAEHYSGVAAAHLAWLLWRSSRLNPAQEPPMRLATLGEVTKAATNLFTLTGQPWRIIPVNDDELPATVLAVWQSGEERLAEAVALARAFNFEGFRVHITCEEAELPLIALLAGTSSRISVGTKPNAAPVQIFAGYPSSHLPLHKALAGGAQLVLVVLGNSLTERALAQRPSDLLEARQPPAWFAPAENTFITAQHLLCAAMEQPLTAPEVLAWQATDLVERLVERNWLSQLPDNQNIAWQPLSAAGDPYEGLGLKAAGEAVSFLYNEGGGLIGLFDPAAFNRWGFQEATLPPGRSGSGVAYRDAETNALTLRVDDPKRRTFPLRRCKVEVREEVLCHTCNEQAIHWGRVVIEEEIYGYREARMESIFSDQQLETPLTTRWAAPAFWLDLAATLPELGQLTGWALVAALPLRALATFTDLVPAYDPTLRRLYFVEAQSGGNGLTAWASENLAEILPFAHQITLSCANDALLESVVQNDQAWLATLLPQESEVAEEAVEETTVTLEEVFEAAPLTAEVAPEAAPVTLEKALEKAPLTAEVAPEAAPVTLEKALEAVPLTAEVAPEAAPVTLEEVLEAVPLTAEVAPEAAPVTLESLPSPEPAPALETANAQLLAAVPFQPGDLIFCASYGDGFLQALELKEGEIILRVAFAEHGEQELPLLASQAFRIADAPETEKPWEA